MPLSIETSLSFLCCSSVVNTPKKRQRRRRRGNDESNNNNSSSSSVPSLLFIMIATTTLLLSSAVVSVNAFVPSVATTTTTTPTANDARRTRRMEQLTSNNNRRRRRDTAQITSSSTKLSLSFESFSEVLYNFESTASGFANSGLQSSTMMTSLPIMYGAGLLTSISPCVWGLLPLTMSYISNAAGERSDKQTTIPTIVFATGLASVFCTLGLIASEVGNGVFGSSSSGNGTDNGFIVTALSSGVCLLMGLQLLNLITLPSVKPPKMFTSLPFQSSSTTTSSSSSNNEPILIGAGGNILSSDNNDEDNNSNSNNNNNEFNSLIKTFFLGGSTALVSSPCATPVLTSILAFVANTHNPILGTSYLLCYTLGYSTPLLLVSATGGQLLTDIKNSSNSGIYGKIGPWITPMTAGILLWYGTSGLLTSMFGDPSIAGLTLIL